MSDPAKTGTLYLVATPIGNGEDMTVRAVNVLRSSDVIAYEERREGERLLAAHTISGKITEQLNEHTDEEASDLILHHLGEGRDVALVSDAGTPVFADPGARLLRKAIARGIRVVPVPGASSLLPALVASGLPMDSFRYCGFLSPKSERRLEELRRLAHEERTMVFLDTPYRLVPLLRDIAGVFGAERRACVAFNITMPDERFFRDKAGALLKSFEERPMKGEFVIIVEGARRR